MLHRVFAPGATASKQRLLWLSLAVLAASIGAFEPQISLSQLQAEEGLTMYGSAYDEHAGAAVSGAGDANGDGFGDVLVGAPFAKSATTAGKAYLVFGGAQASSAIVLEELEPGKGVVLSSDEEGDETGAAVAFAGDLNGDGFDDLLVGARSATGALPASGKTFVVFGSSDLGVSASIDLGSLDGSSGFVVNGEAINDQSGFSVAGAGDFNKDGFDDFIIGAPNRAAGATVKAGAAYLLYGSASLGSQPSIDLSTLDGSNGFVITGKSADSHLGTSVSGAGDVNKDGYADIIIGAPGEDNKGAAYIIYGGANVAATGALSVADVDDVNGVRLAGIDDGDLFGTAVAQAGDVNGDGFVDVIIGASGTAGPANGLEQAGEAYVVFGSDSLSSGSLGDLDGTNGFVVYGADVEDSTGAAVAGAGDVNGDQLADIMIGAPGSNGLYGNLTNSGATYVMFGARTIGAGGVVRLQNFVAGTDGFVAFGGAALDKSGSAIGSVKSFHTESATDVIIAAYDANSYMDEMASSGATYVLFGEADVTPTSAPTIAPTPAPTPIPPPSGEFGFGTSMAFTGVSRSELKGSAEEQQILVSALAQFDVHVKEEDIKIEEIDDYEGVGAHGDRAQAATDTVEVDFYIRSYLSRFGTTTQTTADYQAAYKTLAASLTEFFNSGAYDAAIAQTATDAGVPFAVTTIPYTLEIDELDIGPDKDDNDDDDEDELSAGAIAGIVIVVAVVVGAVAGGLYLYKAKPKNDHALLNESLI